MELDDDLCLCFHVSKRKVINFIRNEQPVAASQLSECYGAGSGCGWCRSYLKVLYNQLQSASKLGGNNSAGTVSTSTDIGDETAKSYAALRQNYLKKGSGTPPPRSS
jgi:bacterioferritin-associated ferredoxin